MTRTTLLSTIVSWILCGCVSTVTRDVPLDLGPAPPDDGKLRIIAFGAHPDDCEIKVGGAGARWAAAGHHVKLVSLTNGDIGHWRTSGPELAARRHVEVQEAAKLLGVTTQVLPIHDGELLPTLEVRRAVVRLIRHWNADVVLSHRPNDYHPDHRYTGVLVQDAAYMVTVPFFCPDTPHLTTNPAFMYYADRFEEPLPFLPDVVVSIDDVVERKLDALGVMVSQFFEGGANGHAGLLPDDEAGVARREKEVRDRFSAWFASTAEKFREDLVDRLGEEEAAKVKHAEAFAYCEYGRRPTDEETERIFSFEP